MLPHSLSVSCRRGLTPASLNPIHIVSRSRSAKTSPRPKKVAKTYTSPDGKHHRPNVSADKKYTLSQHGLSGAFRDAAKEATSFKIRHPRTKGPLTPDNVETYLADCAVGWSTLPHLKSRLISFGIPQSQIDPALTAFVSALQAGRVISTLRYNEEYLQRIAYDLQDQSSSEQIDIALTRLFYEWAAHPTTQAALKSILPQSTLDGIRELFKSADMSNPAARFDIARAAARRKIIMHVGPTNSGKTHNALRALAAAKSGVYAGPLRLLAHEIWERLNKGQIVPLGVDPEADAEPDLDSNMDIGPDKSGRAVVRRDGNPKYARQCNLVTGEERKIMDEDCGLTSCTVEMLNYLQRSDVAVVDEIQLLADPTRGGAWTNAVLGLNASELHLCGEETAVPLVEALLKDTGDEIIVNRYQRLTPLKVAEQSLGGDLTTIDKGDCVVTFSRSGIFALKNKIELQTNRKCAVAYGRLPPEIRSEQAHLFNDPNSGYDILVGSDAIGMGLNLKIRRVIFEMVAKFDGHRLHYLSNSQFKQIAGRAGRFGLHGSDQSGGVATTLHEDDLPILRAALKAPVTPLRIARIRGDRGHQSAVAQALPPDAPFSTTFQVMKYVSKVHPCCEFEDVTATIVAMDYIDKVAGKLTIADRGLLNEAPVPWRDGTVVRFMSQLLRLYQTNYRVHLQQALQESGLLDVLRDISAWMEKDDTEKVKGPTHLNELESLHKCVLAYIWLAFRNPISFSDMEYAVKLKGQTESAIEWYLKALSQLHVKSKRALGRKIRPKKPILDPVSATALKQDGGPATAPVDL
ncbi:P-loop containing nucleoside triphosphate hydrolase protein [Panus rudis PR-1116 ss-1]|nr:P-loop containing nucleoside triphosphate hydrolase protein [Panus rudis PR-1116 ss-1]